MTNKNYAMTSALSLYFERTKNSITNCTFLRACRTLLGEDNLSILRGFDERVSILQNCLFFLYKLTSYRK